MRIFGVMPFNKTTHRQQLNGEKSSKMRWRANPLIFWGGELCPLHFFYINFIFLLTYFIILVSDFCTVCPPIAITMITVLALCRSYLSHRFYCKQQPLFRHKHLNNNLIISATSSSGIMHACVMYTNCDTKNVLTIQFPHSVQIFVLPHKKQPFLIYVFAILSYQLYCMLDAHIYSVAKINSKNFKYFLI